MKNLTDRELSALSWAVSRAAEWRGAEIGNPDPAPLDRFDRRVSEARMALRKVREVRKLLKELAYQRAP
jgi:hypothetical protein